jgi:hypothetical protein
MRRCFLSSFLGLLIASTPALARTAAATGGIIEGTVVNSAIGAPIAGALVKLAVSNSQSDPLFTKTDDQGHFSFANLPLGDYQLGARRPGFMITGDAAGRTASAYVMLRPWKQNPRSHPDVDLDQTTDGDGTLRVTAKVRMIPYAVIAGRVTDPSGLPMAGSNVQIYAGGLPELANGQLRPAGVTVQTNDLGEYRFAFLKPGTYYVMAGRSFSAFWDNSYHPTYFPAALTPESARPLELGAGQQEQADIKIVGQSGVRVAGRIEMPSTPEKPEGSYRTTSLMLAPRGSGAGSGYTPSTNSGTEQFEFRQVSPGDYQIMALTTEGSLLFQGPKNKTLFGAIGEVTVGDHDVESVKIEMKPLPDIPGIVTFGEGCTPGAVRIMTFASGPSMGQTINATSGADGKFVVTGLSPGRFSVKVLFEQSSPSVHLDGHDITNDSFDYPPASGAEMRINLTCRRTQ